MQLVSINRNGTIFNSLYLSQVRVSISCNTIGMGCIWQARGDRKEMVTISQVDKRDNGFSFSSGISLCFSIGYSSGFSLSISASATENMDSMQSSVISHTSVVDSSIAGAA